MRARFYKIGIPAIGLLASASVAVSAEENAGAIFCTNANGDTIYDAEGTDIWAFTATHPELTLVDTIAEPSRDLITYTFDPGDITCIAVTS